MIYLDNAATTNPKPSVVMEASRIALEKYSSNPGRSGHEGSILAAEEIYKCREKAAHFFNCASPENVVFTLNCTHAINYVIKGVLKPNSHVITSSLEHNAVMRPLETLKKRGQIDYDEAEVFFGDNDATLRSFERLIKKNTLLIICTHTSNVCGITLPIERIGKLCKEYNIPFAVDAAQSAGVLPIDMEKMNIDFLCCPGHKGLYGPMGTGILISSGRRLETIIEGGTGNFSIDLNQPEDLPERFESGTVNTPGIIALAAGINFVEKKGIDKIYSHEMRLIGKAYENLQEMKNISLYTVYPNSEYFAPVLCFNVVGIPSMEVAKGLNDRGVAVRAGLHCAPSAHNRLGTIGSGAVRISPSIFTTEHEINSFINFLNLFIKSYK